MSFSIFQMPRPASISPATVPQATLEPRVINYSARTLILLAIMEDIALQPTLHIVDVHLDMGASSAK